MRTTPVTATSRQEGTTHTLRQVLTSTSFALVLFAPKILNIRRNAGSWLAFRIFIGLAGAALVIVPLSLSNSWLIAPAGLIMFLVAILLPPAKPTTTRDDKARELGALMVVNGGAYQPAGPAPVPVHLFVGQDRISVLDSRYNSVLFIPVDQISSATAMQDSAGWVLQIHWSYQISEFAYRGVFAEHLVRIAESTISSVIPSTLPVSRRSRAAGA